MSKPRSLKQSIPGAWALIRYLRPYIRKHRLLLTGSFGALFIGVLMRALEPWPLKFVIDYVIVPAVNLESSVATPAGQWSPLLIVVVSSLAIILILGLRARALATYYQKVGFALTGNKVITEVRADLFRHIQCLSMSFHSRARSGDLIVRVIGDIGLLRDFSVTALMPLVGSIMVLVVMAALMLWLNWKLALMVIVLLPLYWLPTYLLTKKIQNVSRTQRKRESAMASMATESIGAMQVVQSLSLEDNFANQFAGQGRKSLKEGVKTRRLLARLQGTVQVMTGVSTAAVLFYGTLLILRGQLSAGDLLVFLSYLKAAFKPMQDFAKYSGRMAKASASGERVIEMFETKPDITDSPDARPAPQFEGTIEFDHVDFEYEKDHPVLRDVCLEIGKGEVIALVGPSGSGKSTVIGLISRLYDPAAGRILIDGIDIRTVTIESLRRQISVVLQDTTLFATSVRENIAMGSVFADEESIASAARLAQAAEFIGGLPQGLDTQVGERGITLSAGQRQRIAVARAIVSQAPILILDEPTTGLDPDNSRLVLEGLRELMKGRTVILITHKMDEARQADRVFTLEQGRLSQQSDPISESAL
jgi:ATP-binding cassette subfamily B protein